MLLVLVLVVLVSCRHHAAFLQRLFTLRLYSEVPKLF